MVLIDRDLSNGWAGAADGTLERRDYVCQNWRHDVSAIVTDTGKMVEWAKYSAYGVPFGLPAGDTDSDGDWDATDSGNITGSYDVRKDANLDGTVDSADITHANAITGGYHTMGRGALSAVGNRRGYAGYEHAAELAGTKWHTRDRVLDSELGIRLTRLRRPPIALPIWMPDYYSPGLTEFPCLDLMKGASACMNLNCPYWPVICLLYLQVGKKCNQFPSVGCQECNSRIVGDFPQPQGPDKCASAVKEDPLICGFYSCKTFSVKLCSDAPAECNFCGSTLIHELVHALDDCGSCTNNNTCDKRLCNEIRAYAMQPVNKCNEFKKDSPEYIDCLCASACTSAMYGGACWKDAPAKCCKKCREPGFIAQCVLPWGGVVPNDPGAPILRILPCAGAKCPSWTSINVH